MGASAREVALRCLLKCERQGAWSEGYLKSAMTQAGLDRRDRALCSRLVYGVEQRKLLLDWHLSRLCQRPLDRLDAAARICLRLGAYQLLFLDRVPGHAAVHETVELCKKYAKNPKTASLVNAVLRALQREREGGLPEPEALSIRYSHPAWLVDTFSRRLPPDEVEALLSLDDQAPPTCIQANTLRTTGEALAAALRAEGVEAAAHPWLPDCLLLEGTGDLSELKAFREGLFYVQDAAAHLAVSAAGPRPGMMILDACAAPGGKSFAAAIAMECKGNILSCDIHPHKKALIEAGAARLGLSNMTVRVQDAKVFDPALSEGFDLVLADVPCSGLGVIRKKPDIRYKDPAALEGLPQVQRDILSNVARYVKPGGCLLYSTCTLLRRENEDIVTWFLEKEDCFTLEPFVLPGPVGPTDGMVTLWPHRHGADGFFLAKLRRS